MSNGENQFIHKGVVILRGKLFDVISVENMRIDFIYHAEYIFVIYFKTEKWCNSKDYVSVNRYPRNNSYIKPQWRNKIVEKFIWL